jgi:Protein of unknown function (DUF4229)
MLRYTVLRLLVFLGCLAALWLLGLRDRDEVLLLVVGAGVLSAVISIFALARFRDDYAAQVQAKVERRRAAKQQRGADATDEDAEDAEVSDVSEGSKDDGSFR